MTQLLRWPKVINDNVNGDVTNHVNIWNLHQTFSFVYEFNYLKFCLLMILTEFLIFDCHLECRKYKHYHCCHCPTTIINKADFIKHINVCKHSALQVNHTVPSATQCVEMTPQVNHTVPSATQCVEMTPQVNHTVPSTTQCVEMTPQVNHTVPSPSQCVEMIIVESLCSWWVYDYSHWNSHQFNLITK